MIKDITITLADAFLVILAMLTVIEIDKGNKARAIGYTVMAILFAIILIGIL